MALITIDPMGWGYAAAAWHSRGSPRQRWSRWRSAPKTRRSDHNGVPLAVGQPQEASGSGQPSRIRYRVHLASVRERVSRDSAIETSCPGRASTLVPRRIRPATAAECQSDRARPSTRHAQHRGAVVPRRSADPRSERLRPAHRSPPRAIGAEGHRVEWARRARQSGDDGARLRSTISPLPQRSRHGEAGAAGSNASDDALIGISVLTSFRFHPRSSP